MEGQTDNKTAEETTDTTSTKSTFSIPETFGFTPEDTDKINDILYAGLSGGPLNSDPTVNLKDMIEKVKTAFPDKQEDAVFVLGYGVGMAIHKKRVLGEKIQRIMSGTSSLQEMIEVLEMMDVSDSQTKTDGAPSDTKTE